MENSTIDSSQQINSDKAPAAKLTEKVTRGVSRQEVEVIVYWQQTVLESYWFKTRGKVTLGHEYDVDVPSTNVPEKWTLIDLSNEVVINSTDPMRLEVISDGKTTPLSPGHHTLKDSDLYIIYLDNGVRITIRFAPQAPPIVMASPMMLELPQLLVVVAAVVVAILMAWIIALKMPELKDEDATPERMAQVVFVQKAKPVDTDRTVVAPVADKENSHKKINDQDVKEEQPVVPARDAKKTGLLAAFGANTRDKLNQINKGSKDLIGAGGSSKTTAATAFGAGGISEGIDSQMKETGAGKGRSTYFGVADVGTRGRSTGNGNYGAGTDLGGKDRVQISAGGAEESFSGSIDREAVRRVVRSALAQIKACYEREYRKDSKLEGKLVISWEIHAQGIVKNAQLLSDRSTMSNNIVKECIKSKILGLRFPEPPIGTFAEIVYPFIFVPDK